MTINANEIVEMLEKGVLVHRLAVVEMAKELVRLQNHHIATYDELIALLPSTYYMDQPDGGGVTVLEQLRRMAKDADRYRKARQGAYRLAVGNPTPEEFDAACDAVVRP